MQGILVPITGDGLVVTLLVSIGVAELVGYLLHRLLHSEQLASLSRPHLIHHMVHYRPNQPMRSASYRNATGDRAAIGNVGMEWILPIALVLLVSWGVMNLFKVCWLYQVVALVTMISWAVLMFSYLHDRMHLKDFWMVRTPLIGAWFVRARRLHDIHHHALNDQGQMNRNFGIGFFWFDRLFGTYKKKHSPLNRHGYRAALRRYRLEALNEEDDPSIPSGFRI